MEIKAQDYSRLLENNRTTRQEALDRCEDLIDQYLRWKRENHQKSNRAQAIALIFTAAIPVVLLLPWEFANIVGALFSSVAAVATGLLAIHGWRENFIRYGYIYHMLQVEKFLFKAGASKEYQEKDSAKITQNFVKRIEGLVTLDVTEWRTEMQRLDERTS